MWFHHIVQAGHELLTSGDLPAPVSQSARIKGMHKPPCQANMLHFIGEHTWTQTGSSIADILGKEKEARKDS